ncbi:MAG TPA: hypothetical protein VIL65_00390 [Beijerinckiaceae bacterium]|jgi:hypothetical protein
MGVRYDLGARLLCAGLALAASGAAFAQPMMLPGARFPGAAEPAPGAPPGPDQPAPGAPPAPRPDPGPPVARPVAIKAPSEDAVVGKELKLNGRAGSLRLERAGKDLKARLTLAGTKPSRPGEACAVTLGEGAGLPLASQGRPDGAPRYTLEATACPMVVDVLDGGVLVTQPKEACLFEAAECRVDVRGLWGPEPSALVPQAKTIEQARGGADKAVRENYRVLSQRATGAGVRTVVGEQAAFSSEREMLCRDYARESTHGFCHARFTEARALSLGARLGLTASANPDRPRPPRPRPPVAPPGPTAQPAPAQPGQLY